MLLEWGRSPNGSKTADTIFGSQPRIHDIRRHSLQGREIYAPSSSTTELYFVREEKSIGE